MTESRALREMYKIWTDMWFYNRCDNQIRGATGLRTGDSKLAGPSKDSRDTCEPLLLSAVPLLLMLTTELEEKADHFIDKQL